MNKEQAVLSTPDALESRKARIENECIHLLYRLTPSGVAATVIGALIAAFAVRGVISKAIILLWLTAGLTGFMGAHPAGPPLSAAGDLIPGRPPMAAVESDHAGPVRFRLGGGVVVALSGSIPSASIFPARPAVRHSGRVGPGFFHSHQCLSGFFGSHCSAVMPAIAYPACRSP